MTIYGHGVFLAPGTERVIHDFEKDGPFETLNGYLIEEAKKLGFSFEPIEQVEKKTVTIKVKRPYKKRS